MQTHALLQRGKAVRFQEIGRTGDAARTEPIGLGGYGRTEIVAGDVAPEVQEAEGNREMSGVEHLYDFSHDFVAREPSAVGKPRLKEVREDVSPSFTARDALVDDAYRRLHPPRSTRPYHDQWPARIASRSAGVVFAVQFVERNDAGAAFARTVPLEFRVQYDTGGDSGRE